MMNRDSRSYLSKHWRPAPPAVWLLVLLLLCLLGFGAALGSIVFL